MRYLDQVTETDCLGACVASVIGLPEVLAEDSYHLPDGNEIIDLNKVLEPLGWAALYIGHEALPAWVDYTGALLIACGQSPRGDWRHAVLWSRGKLEHDPHPSREGIVGEPMFFYILTLSIPVDPLLPTI